jgi:hypothetical protein
MTPTHRRLLQQIRFREKRRADSPSREGVRLPRGHGATNRETPMAEWTETDAGVGLRSGASGRGLFLRISLRIPSDSMRYVG